MKEWLAPMVVEYWQHVVQKAERNYLSLTSTTEQSNIRVNEIKKKVSLKMPSFFCAVASQSPRAYNIFPQVALLFFVIFATVVKFTSVKKKA